MLAAIIFVVFPFCMVFAAVSDLLSMTIANRVSLLLVATFVVVAPMTGMEWSMYFWHLAAGVVVLFITFAMFAIGGMGGGDAKLLSATAVWMGMSMTLLQYAVYSTLIGGVLTIAILLYRGSPLSVFTGHMIFFRNLANEKAGVPYGLALSVGGMIAFPSTELARWAMLQF